MELHDLCEPIRNDLHEVESLLKSWLVTGGEPISEIVKYNLDMPGKRLRPALTLMASKLGDHGGERVVQLAAAIELMHTASLVHDDILDRGVLRRKKVTVNVKWDNELSVLFGDFLFSRALSLLVLINSPQALVSLVKVINEMCVGEMTQVNRRYDFSLRKEDYLSIIKKKTALLFSASCGLGASLGGATVCDTEIMYHYGLDFGTAYQIVDDCLDLIGSENVLGKSLRSDVREGKMTLPLIQLLDVIPYQERKRLEVLLKTGEGSDAAVEIREKAQRYGAIDYSLEMANQFMKKAKEGLQELKGFHLKSNLLELADCVLEGFRDLSLTELLAVE